MVIPVSTFFARLLPSRLKEAYLRIQNRNSGSPKQLPKLSDYLVVFYYILAAELIALLILEAFMIKVDLDNLNSNVVRPIVGATYNSAKFSVENLNSNLSDEVAKGLIKTGFFESVAIMDDFARFQSLETTKLEESYFAELVAYLLREESRFVIEEPLPVSSGKYGSLVLGVNLIPYIKGTVLASFQRTIALIVISAIISGAYAIYAKRKIHLGLGKLVDWRRQRKLNTSDYSKLHFDEFEKIARLSDREDRELKNSVLLISEIEMQQAYLNRFMEQAFDEAGLISGLFLGKDDCLYLSSSSLEFNWPNIVSAHCPKSSKEFEKICTNQDEVFLETLEFSHNDKNRKIKKYHLYSEGRTWVVDWVEMDNDLRFFIANEVTTTTAKLNTQAHAEKMQALGRISSGVAHEFNNMLAIAVLEIEMVLNSFKVGSDIKRHLNSAIRAADRASMVVKSLKKMSKLQENNAKVIRLTDWAKGVQPMLDVISGPGIQIEINEITDVSIQVDEGLMDTAFVNLVKNASEAIQGNGVIQVATHLANASELATYSDLRDQEVVAITVSDNGKGMTKEVMQKIFEPFYSTNSAHEGTGLGLSEVYTFVRNFGGEILCNSRLNEGTTFTIYFPICEMEQPQSTKEPELVTHSLSSKRNIFILEDEENLLKSYKMILGRTGAKIYSARSIESALEAVGSIPNIDVAIIDGTLPDGNGFTLIEPIISHHPDAQIIFCSGLVTSQHRQHNSVAAFLEKPVSLKILTSTVDEVLARKSENFINCEKQTMPAEVISENI